MRLEFPGAHYVDSTVRGDVVASYHGRVQTLNGPVPFDKGDGLLRYLALCEDGRFAGVGSNGVNNSDDHVWEWVEGVWRNRDDLGIPFGPECVGYDNANQLRVISDWPARGIRYFDDRNQLVTCTETYANPAIELWEYTRRGDLIVGHGSNDLHHMDPVIARTNNINYQVEAGLGRSVKFRLSGDMSAIAFANPDAGMCVAIWMTVPEITALPVVPYKTPVVEPPPPPPLPPENPDVTPAQLATYLAPQVDVVVGVKRDYPNLKAHEIVDQSIHRLNRKHKTDRYGRKARQASGGNPNDDVITIRLHDTDHGQKKLIDVLLGAKEGRNEPTWDVRPASEEAGNGFWTPAVHPDRDGKPIEEPPPGEEPPPISDIEAQLADFRRVLLETKKIAEGAHAGVHSLTQQMDRLLEDGSTLTLQAEDGSYLQAVGGGSGEARFRFAHDTPGSPPAGWETYTVRIKR